jgi:4-amino-4-deoxy-L-arabinose transferase-like glycosyltransferase
MRERTYALLAILVSVAVFTLIFFSLKKVRFCPKADEGYHLMYALSVVDNGVSGFSDNFRFYIREQKAWIFPPPVRVGYIGLSAIWLKIAGESFLSLSYLSLLSFFSLLLLSFYFAKKHFGAETAFLFVALLATSPINCAMARRALGDATSNLFLTISFWLFLDVIRERKGLLLFVLFYSLSVLTKESFAFFSPIFVCCLLAFKRLDRTSFFSVSLFPAFIVLIVLTALSEGLFVEAVFNNASTLRTNQYSILFGQGPAYRYIIDHLILSPVTLLLSIGFLFSYALSEKELSVSYFVLILLGTFLIFGLFPNKCARYTIMAETPIMLFSLLMLQRLFLEKRALIFCIVALIALFDYMNFGHLFVEEGIYDPVSFQLLRAKEIIP